MNTAEENILTPERRIGRSSRSQQSAAITPSADARHGTTAGGGNTDHEESTNTDAGVTNNATESFSYHFDDLIKELDAIDEQDADGGDSDGEGEEFEIHDEAHGHAAIDCENN